MLKGHITICKAYVCKLYFIIQLNYAYTCISKKKSDLAIELRPTSSLNEANSCVTSGSSHIFVDMGFILKSMTGRLARFH